MNTKLRGDFGERLARKYYETLQCEVLETNYRYKRYEVDLIVLIDARLLVFVEVKQRTDNYFGEAETFVSEAQQNRIKEVAEEYIHAIDWKKDIRFDIVCVDAEGGIVVFEDAF